VTTVQTKSANNNVTIVAEFSVSARLQTNVKINVYLIGFLKKASVTL